MSAIKIFGIALILFGIILLISIKLLPIDELGALGKIADVTSEQLQEDNPEQNHMEGSKEGISKLSKVPIWVAIIMIGIGTLFLFF